MNTTTVAVCPRCDALVRTKSLGAHMRRAHTDMPQERLRAALKELYDVTAGMDCEIDGERPTEERYRAAMREAKEALLKT